MAVAPRPELLDSRRLTGPNRLSDGPGALITVRLPTDGDALVDCWMSHARRLSRDFSWDGADQYVWRHQDSADLLIDAPPDVLYAATEVNEWAWTRALAEWSGTDPPRPDQELARLRRLVAEEQKPGLLALRDNAKERDVTFLSDDEFVSVGTGSGCSAWPVGDLPAPKDVDWGAVHDVPVVLVTGSNGKTTTVRLVAAIVEAAGQRAGFCCTDGIYANGVLQNAGDWSGPGGGRSVLRNPDIDFAILEAARGGILRRGLATDRAQGAAVTNVAADHLGEWGVHDVQTIADAKLTVAKAIPPGRLVVNADDPVLMRTVRKRKLKHVTISLTHRGSEVGVGGWGVVKGSLVRHSKAGLTQVVNVHDVPVTDGGKARFNVYNALCAAALADVAGVSASDIASGLAGFTGDAAANPGRANRITLGGVETLVDFAHNPHGVRALCHWARTIPAERRLTMVGQAGDRDDHAIRMLAEATVELEPDLVVVKAMTAYRRGRETGEVTGLLRRSLQGSGLKPECIKEADSEMEAVRLLLKRSRPGDLLVLPVQASRDDVLNLLERLEAAGWRPGDPLD